MNYAETINYLLTRLPMYSRIGSAAYRADLINTIKLCEFLGNPQHKFKSIHVAGTNGKGSVTHMLASIFQEAGYKTGLYTSPHLKDFRERIKVSGSPTLHLGSGLQMIDKSFVTSFTEKIQPLIDELDPSFFELTVAMAFDYFALQEVDIAIVEVGLGGRLDSTNVITPDLSIITNIGWDHMNLLGNSLEKIAFEKAGIIKPGIPVIIGEYSPGIAPVFEAVAKEKNAGLTYASQQGRVIDWRWEKQELVVEVAEGDQTDHSVYHLDLPGIYQTKNLVTVLAGCHQLQQQGWALPATAIHEGLRQVKKISGLHGRWEIIHQNPSVILDVAHNEDGVRQLLLQLEVMEPRHLHIVLGLVKDKEVEKITSLLPKNATYYFTKAQIPRAMPEEELAAKAGEAGLKGAAWPTVNLALHAALANAHPADLILVCGSVFLVGEVEL